MLVHVHVLAYLPWKWYKSAFQHFCNIPRPMQDTCTERLGCAVGVLLPILPLVFTSDTSSLVYHSPGYSICCAASCFQLCPNSVYLQSDLSLYRCWDWIKLPFRTEQYINTQSGHRNFAHGYEKNNTLKNCHTTFENTYKNSDFPGTKLIPSTIHFCGKCLFPIADFQHLLKYNWQMHYFNCLKLQLNNSVSALFHWGPELMCGS